MELKYGNIMALVLAIFAAILAVGHRREITAVLDSIGHIGPGHSIEEQTLGLGVLGVCLVSLVAVVRLFTDRNRRDS